MIKQYQCKSCGLMFEADDTANVTCPHCHSFSVEEVKSKSHVKTIIIAAVAAVVVIVGVVLAVKFMRAGSGNASHSTDVEQIEGSTPAPETPAAPPVDNSKQGLDDLRNSGNAYADSVARADSIARAEAEAQKAKEEAAAKAREEAAKQPTVERISASQVQSMLQTYLNTGNINIFRTQQFAGREPRISSNIDFVSSLSSLLDYKNIGGEVRFTVTTLDYNANNQVTCIHLNIQE